MALLKDQLQVAYTTDAVQNKVEGKIVLQLVVCSNGRVSDIRIDESLPFGLTELSHRGDQKSEFPTSLTRHPAGVSHNETDVRLCPAGVHDDFTLKPQKAQEAQKRS